MFDFFHVFNFTTFVQCLIVINIVTLLVFMVDRFSSLQGGLRISQVFMWLLILAGGGPAAWVGIKAFKHGTFETSIKWGATICMVFYMCVILSFVG